MTNHNQTHIYVCMSCARHGVHDEMVQSNDELVHIKQKEKKNERKRQKCL